MLVKLLKLTLLLVCFSRFLNCTMVQNRATHYIFGKYPGAYLHRIVSFVKLQIS